jgi:hypothetical protein
MCKVGERAKGRNGKVKGKDLSRGEREGSTAKIGLESKGI